MSRNGSAASNKSMVPNMKTLSCSMGKLLRKAKRGTRLFWPDSGVAAKAPASSPAAPAKEEFEIEQWEDSDQRIRRVEKILFENEDNDPHWLFIHREFTNDAVDLSPSLSLHEQFDMACIRAWDPNGFEFIQKLQDAVRNQGEVLLMRERSSNAQVAVKRMPTTRVGSSNEDFRVRHPDDCENPWQDIGCMRYLNSIGYPYTCQLLGVFYDKQHAYVVSSFATQGDLHTWCSLGPKPSLESEVHKQPVCVEILRAMKQLHDSSVVHGDVSLENICLSQPTPFCNDGKDDGNKGVKITLQVKVIDFGVASACRQLKYSGGGKHRYHAPEVHSGENYDGFLSDAFSIGVVLYAVMTMDYPWLSTKPGNCPCWDYVRTFGLRSFLERRRVNDGGSTASEVLSEPLVQLLEGLLAPDPAKRLTLGERSFESCGRRSVWDEPWVAKFSTAS